MAAGHLLGATMTRNHLLGTTMLVGVAMATLPGQAQDFQLTDRTFLEFEGYAAPSTTFGGDNEGFHFLGEVQGRASHLLGNGYAIGAQTRIEAKTAENDFSAEIEVDQGWAFFSTPVGDVTSGITAGATTVFGFGAPSAIGRGYGVNSPEFVHAQNPLVAPFAATSSPTFFDTNFRVGVNTPITNDWVIAASWAPRVDATGTQTHDLEDVTEIAGLYRFNVGNVDVGLSTGFMQANTNNGNTFPGVAFDDQIRALSFGTEIKYGGFTAGGSYLTYDNLEGFDDVDFNSYTAGITYRTDPWIFGFSYGRSMTDLPESGTSFNVLLGDATTDIMEVAATYAWLPGVDLGAAVVHTNRQDNRFGTGQNNSSTYGVLQTTFKFGEADFLAAPAQAVFGPEGKYRGHFELEYRGSNDRQTGTGNLFAPLWQDDDSLVYTDLRFQNDDAGSGEYNLGLGVRQILGDEFIVGAYGFFDQRTTNNDNTFNQATFGVEALTEDFDVRANAYIAEKDAKSIPNAAGTAVVQNNQIFVRGQAERALSGFDAEIGYKLPLGWDDVEVRVYGGGYHFDATNTRDVSGPRVRAEMRIDDISFLGDGSRFTLGAEAQDDDVRGEQYFGVARLRIPFSTLLGGRKSDNLSALERRMTERVQRDVDVVTGSTTAGLEAAVNPLTGQPYGNIAYANGTGGGNGNSPTDATDVQSAVAQAGIGGVVVVDGAAGLVNTNGTVTLANGQTLLGADSPFALPVVGVNSGATATAQVSGSGARPTINARNAAAPNLQVATNSRVQNVNLTGGSSGIVANNVGNVTINTVNVSGTNPGNLAGSSGIAILNTLNTTLANATIGTNGGGDATGLLVNNSGGITATNVTVGSMSGATSSGVTVLSSLDSSFTGITVGNNTGTGAATGMSINNSARITANNVSIGNLAGAASSGISVLSSLDTSLNNVTVGNNTGTGSTTGALVNNSARITANNLTIGNMSGNTSTGVAITNSLDVGVTNVAVGNNIGTGATSGVLLNNSGRVTASNVTIGNMAGATSSGVAVLNSVTATIANVSIGNNSGTGATAGFLVNNSTGITASDVTMGTITGTGATGASLIGSSNSSISNLTTGVHSGNTGAGVLVNNGVGTTALSNLTIGNMTGAGSIGVSVQNSVNTNVTNANIASVTGAGANGIQYNVSSGIISGASILQVGTNGVAGFPVGINLFDSVVTVENSTIGSAAGGGVFGQAFFPIYLQVAGSNATLNNNQMINGSGANNNEFGIRTRSGNLGAAVTLSGTGNSTTNIQNPCGNNPFVPAAPINGNTGLNGGTCP